MTCQHKRVAVIGNHETAELSAHCSDCRAPLPIRYEGDGGSLRVVRMRSASGGPYRERLDHVEIVCGTEESKS